MKLSEMPIGSVVTIGHPNNGRLAVRIQTGCWRLLHNGQIVSSEEFRAGWDTYDGRLGQP